MNANDRFEIIGKLYQRAFGRLRPGKDEPAAICRDSMDADNVKQFEDWYRDGRCFEAALEYIQDLEDQACDMRDQMDSLTL